MAGVRGRIGAALRRAGDVSAAAVSAVSKVTPGRATTEAEPEPGAQAPAKAGRATSGSAKASAKKAPAKKAPAKKAPAKRAAAQKSLPAKKAAATAPPAKKAPVKKAAAAKAPPAKKPPVKKAAAAKAPAKKATTPKATTPKAPAAAKPDDAVAAADLNAAGLTGAELAAMRARLQNEWAEMRLEYENSINALNELRQQQSDGAGDDQVDAGSKTFEREQEQSIAANRRLLLTQIEHALERIDSGVYGACEDCGRPIPKARLQALPMATLDAECKARAERR